MFVSWATHNATIVLSKDQAEAPDLGSIASQVNSLYHYRWKRAIYREAQTEVITKDICTGSTSQSRVPKSDKSSFEAMFRWCNAWNTGLVASCIQGQSIDCSAVYLINDRVVMPQT